MTSRGKLASIGALGVIGALLWTSVGTLESAQGQEKPAVIRRAHTGTLAPTFDEPIFILMLGGDARKGNPERVRMDSIHIVAIDVKNKTGSILGIPRDSYVPIPGRGSNKINSAGYFGGPELMVRTVEGISGCRFDYYTLTNFEGFQKAVDLFGGITFDVKKRIFERGGSRINLFPGTQVFNGKVALAWARNRHNRPRGDFDRSLEQGNLMVAALGEARADYAKNPGIALRALSAMRRNVKMDIPLEEALKLGLAALRIDTGAVSNQVLDGENANEGGASVVKITKAGNNQFVDICSDGQLGS